MKRSHPDAVKQNAISGSHNLLKALKTEMNNPKEEIYSLSRLEISQLPIRKYEGNICLVSSASDLKQAMKIIRAEKFVGLDTETKPSFRKGEFHLPCLVQIAVSKAVYLFRLNRMEFSGELSRVLENPGLIKAGVGLAEDFTNLKNVFPFEPRNVLDLSTVAQQQGIKRSGVRNLAGQLLGIRITKGASTSNWARSELTPKQITYAATDAWVCRELFLRFRQLGFIDKKGHPVPKKPEPEENAPDPE